MQSWKTCDTLSCRHCLLIIIIHFMLWTQYHEAKKKKHTQVVAMALGLKPC